jgi:hypothetical protein
VTAIEAAPTTHAAWRVDTRYDESDEHSPPTDCISDTDWTMVTSSIDTIRDERGVDRPVEIRAHLLRELGPCRRDRMPTGEYHSVVIGVGPQGWDCEPFVAFTLGEIAQLRHHLGELLRWAASDRLE